MAWRNPGFWNGPRLWRLRVGAALVAALAVAGGLAAAPSLWLALEKDGIHDPRNPGLAQLQQPAEALAPLPRDTAGNQVRWVEALDSGAITPRANLWTTAQVRMLDQDLIIADRKSTRLNSSHQ